MEGNGRRTLIGKRIKDRRKQLGLTQSELGERLGINQSTINRYERGTIENDKMIILSPLAEALHVPVEWLTGDTDQMTSAVSDKLDLEIIDELGNLRKMPPMDLSEQENTFAKELLLILLKEYQVFYHAFSESSDFMERIRRDTDQLPLGLASAGKYIQSTNELCQALFLNSLMHTISAFKEAEDIISNYPQHPDESSERLHRLLTSYEQ